MITRCLRALAMAALCISGAMLARAQDWTSMENLPAVDMSGLSPAQKASALKLMRGRDCTCQCGMKVAECRVKDPNCYYSKGLANVIVASLRNGRSEKEALADAEASRFAHPPEHKLLEDPIELPTAGAPETGPDNAPITLVEFTDFQCPYCALATPQLREVLKAYPTQIRLFFKQFPLDIHSQAAFAAAASVAAQKQGKFWQMHDALFASHTDLRRPTVLALASAIGLDMKRFEADVDSADITQGCGSRPGRRPECRGHEYADPVHRRAALQRQHQAGRAEADSRRGAEASGQPRQEDGIRTGRNSLNIPIPSDQNSYLRSGKCSDPFRFRARLSRHGTVLRS